jgi:hypothetical protein
VVVGEGSDGSDGSKVELGRITEVIGVLNDENAAILGLHIRAVGGLGVAAGYGEFESSRAAGILAVTISALGEAHGDEGNVTCSTAVRRVVRPPLRGMDGAVVALAKM